jgi:predicted acyl esterase
MVEVLGWDGGGAANTTTASTSADGHSTGDPVAQNGHEECYAPDQANPGPGVVQYVSEPIPKTFTLMGVPWVDLKFDATGMDYWLTVRLYDQTPDDTMQFVTRGICKVSDAVETGCGSFDLWGNAWTFTKGDRVVLEVSQGDSPTFRKDNMPSSLTFSSADLSLPVVAKSRRHDFRD